MKNNTVALKNFLRQALINSPDDFALNEVKSLIVRALDVIESVEKKRSIRESNQQKRKSELTAKKFDYIKSLKAIESEINSEKNKIDEIKNKKNANKFISSSEESDDIQNVFG